MNYDPSHPIGPQLHAILRQQIIRNALPAGTQISETEVAKNFGISRQPVREAFIKLAQEGLIEIRPQRGTVVRKIDAGEVLDARFVREAVEADIMKLLAAEVPPGVVSDLRRQLDEQRRAAERSPAEFIQADETFHRTLADAAGKVNVWDVLQGLKSQMDRVRFLSFNPMRYDTLIEQHGRIVDAIEKNDVRGAELAAREHLRTVLEDLPLIMRANPDVFTDAPAAAG
ncbi:GntR family transcriptional regulator [Tropicimonas sp. IMCC6043]|uniref:GntR family transcriptional regulator n=1 Tax=Tropicimonas sp. IMCC6043 TaxID=2510645 RepID=UPI001F5C5F05|nr:GntR family transcriptional regulator [Tropicimonas sp. IMCC6043]